MPKSERELSMIEWFKENLTHNQIDGEIYLFGTKISKSSYKNGNKGRSRIRINGIRFSTSRVAFIIAYGRVPLVVDHINGDIFDNRLCNLRECDFVQNGYNRKVNSNNKSGRKGVCFDKNRNKWLVQISVSKVPIRLGSFEDFELACFVREEAECKHHGEFRRGEL